MSIGVSEKIRIHTHIYKWHACPGSYNNFLKEEGKRRNGKKGRKRGRGKGRGREREGEEID